MDFNLSITAVLTFVEMEYYQSLSAMMEIKRTTTAAHHPAKLRKTTSAVQVALNPQTANISEEIYRFPLPKLRKALIYLIERFLCFRFPLQWDSFKN